MKLNNLNVATQLRLGFGVLVLGVFSGVLAWLQTTTRNEHSVRRAIGNFKANSPSMRVEYDPGRAGFEQADAHFPHLADENL